MNSAAQNQSVLTKLAASKGQIENQLPWKDLGNDEKIERLREFTKQSLVDMIQRQEQQLSALNKRIRELEQHKHNEHGQVIVEKVLANGENRIENYSYDPTLPASPSLVPALASGGEYI